MRRSLALVIALLINVGLLGLGAVAAPHAEASVRAVCPPVIDYPPTLPPAGCGPDDPGTTVTSSGAAAADGNLAKTGASSILPLVRLALIALAVGALLRYVAMSLRGERDATADA